MSEFLDTYFDQPSKDFDLKTLVQNNQLYVNKRSFKILTEKYGKNTLKEMLSKAIDQFTLPIPTKIILKDELHSEFLQLRSLDSKELIKKGVVDTKHPYEWRKNLPKDSVYISRNNIGNKASNYFHQENRMKCSGRNYPSPYDAWTMDKYRMSMLEPIWSLKMNKVDRSNLLTSIQMKFYIASQFRPSGAKAIYEYFKAKNVVDMSMGWGDRLCGFYASLDTENYVGTDPNKSLHKGYEDQVNYYRNHNRDQLDKPKEKSVITIDKGAEDTDYSNYGEFDVAFSSPPYLFIEKYSEHDGQSYKKYDTIERWLKEFLFVSIDNIWKALKHNGLFIINISDVLMGKTIMKLCDPMNDYISKFTDSKFIDMMGYEMSKRPNSASFDLKNPFVEPIWIWRKE